MGEPPRLPSLQRWTWGNARLFGSPWSAIFTPFTFIPESVYEICVTDSLFFSKCSLALYDLACQVRLVEEGEGENGEDAHVLERLGCGSRLSNISAIMEMFAEQVAA